MTLVKVSALALATSLATLPLAAQAQTPPAGVTLQQFQEDGRNRLLARDTDRDGRISAAEFAVGGPGGGGRHGGGDMAARMFQRFDSNGDGFLDKAEIDAMLQQRFERLDADHDGVVTDAERQAARGAIHHHD